MLFTLVRTIAAQWTSRQAAPTSRCHARRIRGLRKIVGEAAYVGLARGVRQPNALPVNACCVIDPLNCWRLRVRARVPHTTGRLAQASGRKRGATISRITHREEGARSGLGKRKLDGAQVNTGKSARHGGQACGYGWPG